MSKEEEETKIQSESAGKLMIKDFPITQPNSTISEVEKMLLKNAYNYDTIGYIYVVDKKNRLIGVISIKELFKNSKQTKVKKIMQKEVISVKAHTDQEKVALIALRNKLKNIPVVDKENKILGVVPYKIILEVLHREGIEDTLRAAGIHKFKDPAVEIITAPVKTHVKKRLPWLMFGLLGGIIAALVVNSFESMLDKYILLAAFIPAVVYMADAVGAQAQTIFIRSMALDKKLNIGKYAFREVKINLLLGVILGTLFYVVFSTFWSSSFFGLIIGASIFATVIVSMGISILLPFIFQKLNSDPAISSGPFATAVRDLTSLLVYFAIAHIMIKMFL
jgi:magnesium transporter